MARDVVLNAEPRSETGTGAARHLRRNDRIPAVIYGSGRDTEPLTIARIDLENVMSDIRGETTIIELKVGSKKSVQTLIREVQRHPTRLNVIHVDFLEIHAGEKITVGASIRLVGSPEGVRNQGGILDQIMRELQIRVLPKDLPEHIEVDVTELTVGRSIHVRDLSIPNAEILHDADDTVATVVAPRVEAEPVAVAEETEEGAEEPELIRKPKAEGEEEAEDETSAAKG